MHDKYSYEAALMALHDRDAYRTMACGIAGLSRAADSLSAIARPGEPVRDHHGLAVDFVIEGDYPQYGNNDDRVDAIACDRVERFMRKIQALPHRASGGADPVDPDHHLQRGIRRRNRQHPGRTSGGTPFARANRCMAATGKGRWRR